MINTYKNGLCALLVNAKAESTFIGKPMLLSLFLRTQAIAISLLFFFQVQVHLISKIPHIQIINDNRIYKFII